MNSQSIYCIFIKSGDDVDMVKDDLIDLRTEEIIRHEFVAKNLAEFWCSMIEGYFVLAKQSLQSLIPFAATFFFIRIFHIFSYQNQGSEPIGCSE